MKAADIDCHKVRAFRNKLDAEHCARVLESEEGKLYRAKTSTSDDPNWWHVVDFYNCSEGAVFTHNFDITTMEMAQLCAESLNRIETGGKRYEAVLHKKTGWFKADHYKVVAKKPE